jgi:hypothetical protein
MNGRFLLLLLFFACSLSFPASAQTPRYARVISANANLRDTPSVSGGSEQEVEEGTIVKVLDEKLPWYVVRVVNRVGWMHGNTLKFIATQNPLVETPRQQTVVPEYRPSTPSVPRRESPPEVPARATGENRGYIRGPRGGCYYYSGSGRKVYVDRSLCN